MIPLPLPGNKAAARCAAYSPLRVPQRRIVTQQSCLDGMCVPADPAKDVRTVSCRAARVVAMSRPAPLRCETAEPAADLTQYGVRLARASSG